MSNNITILSQSIKAINGLYSLNDLHKAAGGEAKNKPVLFLRLDQTKALINELKQGTDMHLEPVTTIHGGTNRGTYACKELVIAYGAWISPKLHLAVISAFLNTQQPQIEKTISVEQHQDIVDLVLSHYPDDHGFQIVINFVNNCFRIVKLSDLPSNRFNDALHFIKLFVGYLECESRERGRAYEAGLRKLKRFVEYIKTDMNDHAMLYDTHIRLQQYLRVADGMMGVKSTDKAMHSIQSQTKAARGAA